jgi:hypothetical protein
LKFLHWLIHDLKKLHTKNYKEISLYAQVMHKILFYFEFKID